MKEENSNDFIIIDDDPINNMICTRIIQLKFPQARVKTFTSPEKGLEYVLDSYDTDGIDKATLFLDINMPVLSGWDVLDRFRDSAGSVQNRVSIYMLSSSVDGHDKEKADGNGLVSGYVTKPLSQIKLQDIFG